MTTTRKQYSPKFKARVAVEAIRGEKTLSQLGSQFKVHPIQIAKWRKSALDQFGQQFPALGLIAIAGPVRGAAARPPRVEPEAEVDIDRQLVGLERLGGVVGVMELGHQGAAREEPSPQGGGDAAQTGRPRVHLRHPPVAQGPALRSDSGDQARPAVSAKSALRLSPVR